MFVQVIPRYLVQRKHVHVAKLCLAPSLLSSRGKAGLSWAKLGYDKLTFVGETFS